MLKIEPAEYRQRRESIAEKIGNGTLVLRSAPSAVMHNDVEYPFRQDSDFYYLTGFDEAEAVVVLAPHHPEHRFVLFVREKDLEKETWTGTRVGVEAAQARFAADMVYPIGELDEKLPQYLEKADRLFYRLGRDRDFNARILALWQRLLATYPKRGTGPVAIEDSRFILQSLRAIKSPNELALMRHAAAIAAEAHNRAREFARPGRFEYEVQAEMEYIFRKCGAIGPAYPSIVASGENACILHYTENTRQMAAGDLLLIDAGCCYDYYNSDITRTFPIDGEFSGEQRTLYELVLAAQAAAIATVKPGKTFDRVHNAAVEVLVEGLLELGLLSGDAAEIVKAEKYKPFYMHKTSHWLGLDVHDAGPYKIAEDRWQTLQTGQVLTVEPGLYISPRIQPAEGQPETPERWHGIGIRIEDDVLVTDSGCEILTAAVPKSVEAMQAS